MKLTPKQKMFVDEYLVDFNATRAYKLAYKSCKKDDTAKASASRLLTNVNVKCYIDERIKDRNERIELTQDMVIDELRKIAFSNSTEFTKIVVRRGEKGYYQTAELVPTSELTEDQKAVIKDIKKTKLGTTVETYDKVKALELLGKHLGIFSDNKEKEKLEIEKKKLENEKLRAEISSIGSGIVGGDVTFEFKR